MGDYGVKCPKCGNEIGEGKLLCEVCGAEVNIVPDFDIELEATLSESISSMAEELEAQTNEENIYDDFDEGDDIKLELRDYLPRGLLNLLRNSRIFVAVVFVVLVIGISVIAVSVANNNRNNSYEHQYELALSCIEKNNYTEAAGHLEQALARNSEDLDSWLLLAKCYDHIGQYEGMTSVLEEMLAIDTDEGRMDEAYDLLLGEYERQGRYEEMGGLLKSCGIQRIVSKYNKYTALAPVFNKQGGTYDELISITLSGNTEGIIYYTLDGSAPTSNSMVYETPILLESGEYTIKTMFVNMYGISSDIVTQNYYISLSAPAEPKVSLDSGMYSRPSLIEVYHNNDTKIYYTTDGTAPTKDSRRYSGPIEMPYGISNFSFIAYDNKGLESETVNRTYQLSLGGDVNFSDTLAAQVLVNNLYAIGKISDIDGHLPNKEGVNRYRVQTVAEVEQVIYYIFYEEYVDLTGQTVDTGNIYAVSADTGDLYRAYKVNEGEYRLADFFE